MKSNISREKKAQNAKILVETVSFGITQQFRSAHYETAEDED